MANRDPLTKALWLCEDIPYSVYKEVVRKQIGRTGDKKFHNHCELCKYFHLEVQEGGGWLEICEVTGGQVIGSNEVNSDNCPFMEVEDDK